MDENKPDDESSRNAKYERIFRLINEAVSESPNIKDLSEYRYSRAFYCRPWILNEEDYKRSFTYRKEAVGKNAIDLYKFQYSSDTILFVQFTDAIFTSWFEISLRSIAQLLFRVAVQELDKTDVAHTLNITSEKEKDEAIDYAVTTVLKKLFWALPNLIYQATKNSIHDSVVSYIKTDIEPGLRLHWKRLGLPKNFEYLPHELLELLSSSNKPLEDWQQRFIGNKRDIPEPALLELPGRYKELSKAYGIAKKEHGKKRAKFMAAENRRTVKDWIEQWKKEFDYYPELFPDCLMLICDDPMIMPRQLAYEHLSLLWGYSPDHMRRIIDRQKKKTKDSNKKVAHRKKQ